MTGELYDAETLRDWGVVNRVWEPDEFHDRARELALDLAEGPTVAHAATKTILRGYRVGGVALADTTVPAAGGSVFDTEDTRAAVRSFLADGPGKATFEGR
jgi:enoyl-CoA hydratase/carnithine racemase